MRACNGVELVPFIEAAGQQGDWNEARRSRAGPRAFRIVPLHSSATCGGNSTGPLPPTGDRDRIVAEVQQDLGCQPWQ